MSREIEMDRMTWPEVRDAVQQGLDSVLIPFGSTEQHGPHCPTGTDTFNCYHTALKTAEELGNALVAPALPYGMCLGVMEFPGTVTITAQTLQTVAQEIVMSYAKHGFKKIILFNGHMPQGTILLEAARAVRDVRPDLYVVAVNAWFTLMNDFDELIGVPKGTLSWREFVGHAAIYEASKVMVHDPTLFKADLVKFTPMKEVLSVENPALLFPKRFVEFTDIGAYGDPFVGPGPSKELGQKLIEVCARRTAQALRKQIEHFEHKS